MKKISVEKITISQYSRVTTNLLLKLLDSEALVYFGFVREKGILLEGTNWFKYASSFIHRENRCKVQSRRLPSSVVFLTLHRGLTVAEELYQSAGFPHHPGAQSTVSQISFTLWLKSSG